MMSVTPLAICNAPQVAASTQKLASVLVYFSPTQGHILSPEFNGYDVGINLNAYVRNGLFYMVDQSGLQGV
jgi:hypothetical protein